MKFNYTTADERMSVEIEGEDQKSIFQQIGQFQEVFENNECMKCHDTNVKFVTREVEGNTYYELRCSKCGAKLSFGAHKLGGTLYPKRTAGKNDQSGLEEGSYLPDGGWMKWDKGQNRAV